MPGAPTQHSYLEHRILAALRATHGEKLSDVLAMTEGMAKAFPARRPAPLTLVASNDHPVQKARSLSVFKLVKGS